MPARVAMPRACSARPITALARQPAPLAPARAGSPLRGPKGRKGEAAAPPPQKKNAGKGAAAAAEAGGAAGGDEDGDEDGAGAAAGSDAGPAPLPDGKSVAASMAKHVEGAKRELSKLRGATASPSEWHPCS
jgi:hypothetical protein